MNETSTETAARRGRVGKYNRDHVITVLKNENPRREGTKRHERFSHIRTGMTVGEYYDAGGKSSDLDWAAENRIVAVSEQVLATAA